jgi:uncharacterized protein HemX
MKLSMLTNKNKVCYRRYMDEKNDQTQQGEAQTPPPAQDTSSNPGTPTSSSDTQTSPAAETAGAPDAQPVPPETTGTTDANAAAGTTQPQTQATTAPKLVTSPSADKPAQKGKSKMLIIIIIIVLIIIVAAGAYLFLTRKLSPQAMNMQHNTMQKTAMAPTNTAPSPTNTPVTSANVNQKLDSTDTAIQQAISQANTDINSVSQINSSQDNTSNL